MPPQLHLSHHISEAGDDDFADLSFDSDIQSTREIVEKTEEPGLDSLRGTFGAIGTIVRAKRRMRALSAASHSTQATSESDHSAEPRTSNARPGWLAQHWSTPKGSRFQQMHEEQNAEKGTLEMVEAADEKANLERTEPATSLPLSRTSSPGQATESTPIPLHALHVDFANNPTSSHGNFSGRHSITDYSHGSEFGRIA